MNAISYHTHMVIVMVIIGNTLYIVFVSNRIDEMGSHSTSAFNKYWKFEILYVPLTMRINFSIKNVQDYSSGRIFSNVKGK